MARILILARTVRSATSTTGSFVFFALFAWNRRPNTLRREGAKVYSTVGASTGSGSTAASASSADVEAEGEESSPGAAADEAAGGP